ncbi:MAG: hypothetical protein H0X12_12970 [Nocardioides sp.]|nr:hypothetical protein [Nocardioides sp.]
MPRIAHASGRYDSRLSLFRRDLIMWMQHHSIVTLTEVSAPERKKALWHKGWTVTSGKGEGPGECAILSIRRFWKRLERRTNALTEGGGLARLSAPLSCATGVYELRGKGKRLIVSVAHLPAHVETELRDWVKSGHRNPLDAQALAWVEAVKAWGLHIERMRELYPDADVWAVADWNVDLRQAWARDLIRDLMKPAGDDLRFAYPERGTLDGSRRVIDAALTTLQVDDVKAENAGASDHLAVNFRTRWPLRRKL